MGKVKGIELLGLRVRDRVTGSVGVVTSVSFDLYGCVQGLLDPPTGEDGKKGERWWYDTKRLEVLDSTPIMELPDFSDVPGGQELPIP